MNRSFNWDVFIKAFCSQSPAIQVIGSRHYNFPGIVTVDL